MLQIPEKIKQLFKQGSIRKNIRIHFPNGERKDITNNNLISESFSFTESIMSQNAFKFGLCEASMVEFETFDVENIKGYEIEVFHEIDISSLSEEFIAKYGMKSDDVDFPFYRITYGRFVIDECLRQADATKRKIVAYGKMLEWLQPNDFELLKSKLKFTKKGNYDIDILKYLYSNLSIDSTVPNAIYTSVATEKNKEHFFTRYWEYRIIYKFVNGVGDSELLKINTGNILKTVDDAFDELIEYSKSNIPELVSKLESEMKEIKSTARSTISTVSSEEIKVGILENISNLKGGLYLYSKLPYGNIDINILHSISLVDINSNVIKEIVLRNKDDILIEKVSIDLPKLIVSYPMKKDNAGYYVIQDVPYSEFPTRIEDALELYGKFGKIDRHGNFQMITVNRNLGLVPSNLLVPSNFLVPSSLKGEVAKKEIYSSLWYDDYKTLPYDRVSVSYKNADGEEEYAEKWLVDNESENYNANNYQEYSLTENYLIKNGTFTQEQIEQILDMVASSLIGLQYMPFEMESIGLPYLESGDALMIETKEGNFQSLLLERRIDGIQSLKDNINAN